MTAIVILYRMSRPAITHENAHCRRRTGIVIELGARTAEYRLVPCVLRRSQVLSARLQGRFPA